ncbi:hypothetical protein B5F17_14100 [Butyricicoccus pullicaecorum]|uniref:Uncharacterized protein n=1 Tax=Butyricicoccus pullicaecorum TaxID=501571 RepID=A0A1Y4L0D6_9FIRM|nr:hypothetical protein [Butyricicoccus pullicaecorum]OUP50263.1 hypothetical protein B5F17_14100 [Butyricicoccus pullicaecorum]
MIRFSGLEVRPVSSVTAYPVCRIDRVLVSAYQTLYGEVLYECLGGRLGSEELVPLSRDTANFREAWAIKLRYDSLIEEARREENLRDLSWQKERASG